MRAKFRPPPGVMATSFKGIVQVINKKDGTHYARAWQPPEGPPKTAINKLNTSTFSQTVKMIKNAVDLDVIGAIELTKGTSLLPRDVLMMGAMGTLFQFRFPDGTYVQGGPTLSQSIQALLDSISNVPGTILGRTASGWQALVPSQAGWILTSNGESNPPVWAPNSGPTGGYPGSNHFYNASERAFGTTYTNNNNNPIFLSITEFANGANQYLVLVIDGQQYAIAQGLGAGNNFTIQGLIPIGSEYYVIQSGGSWNRGNWCEYF